MKVHMPSIEPDVYLDPGAYRPIVIKLRSLRIAMTPVEAMRLADLLVDQAEGNLHD